MNIIEQLIKELKAESVSTRKLLAQMPDGRGDWKPHERSFPLGRLAGHVAEIPEWIYHIVKEDEFDLKANNFERLICDNKVELLAKFDEKLEQALQILSELTEEQLQEEWTFKIGDHIISNASKYEEIRKWAFNHQIHHRAQLGVYLRLLDIPIPGMYGPSADDRAAGN